MHSTVIVAANGQRIVGGQETSIGQVPYLVYLRQSGRFICGGSLLTPRSVLSAAHCVYGAKAKDYTVHAGASRLEEQASVVRNVHSFHIAPDYRPSNFDMDVAILRLTTPASLSPGQVATIAPCRTPPSSNAYVRISGWGVTRENNRYPAAQVRTTNVRVLPHLECQLAYAGQALLSDSMLCAAIRGIKDSCSGDSGGPLVFRGQVCGIVSWGFGCARPAYPGVYTSVASPRVYRFIEQTLRELQIE
ncbi:seminase [Drosophila innubila]|uniref:seminase n=1 Tax=Drosophila innubila TaxID=198719 RepID=UPI00148DA09A|nr:seminase [Drosophila innubila]